MIKQTGGAVVRLKDVANVTLGAEDYESEVGFDGKQAVYIGIQVAPAANLLDVIAGVHKVFPEIQALLPHGLNGEIIYDSTEFVNSAINEVIRSLVEALIIVTVVVFLFLGSVRSSLIPTVAIPLSLIGTFIILLALGYSINLLTLLALVLAIGLVVDDAIIVVENVNRHLEEGMAPIDAAIAAARELGGPIIAMTVVLAAVYVPIGFQSGLTGALFAEFAFALVGAVTVSGIVALTLSPMLCSRLLKAPDPERRGWEAQAHAFHRPQLCAAARRLRAAAARQPEYSAGDAGLRRYRARQHLFPVHHRQDRAGAERGSGHHHHAIDRGAGCDAAAAPALFARRSTRFSPAIRRPSTSSSSTCPASRSPAWCSSRGTSARRPPTSCSRCCSRS